MSISKRKLGNDPNNTKWSRNTESFGQKFLRAQGWEPGQYLGAKDSAHSQWHTEANSSHIRVTLKDDLLGLGAKRNNGDECTGLDAFQHLLGRLNGKSEDALETERKAREDIKLNLYVERKLGTIRFVKGGWLVGDQLMDKPTGELAESLESSEQETEASPGAEVEAEAESDTPEPVSKKSKKRKAEDSSKEDGEKPSKKSRKLKKRKLESEPESDNEDSIPKKKEKKSKKRAAKDEAHAEPSAVQAPSGEVDTSASGAKESKQERKERKERERREKKEKKEKRRKEKASAGSGTETGDGISK